MVTENKLLLKDKKKNYKKIKTETTATARTFCL